MNVNSVSPTQTGFGIDVQNEDVGKQIIMKLRKYFASIQNHPKGKYIKTYIFLVVLRVCLVFLPQLGYIHPDEFFQTVEVPTGELIPNAIKIRSFQIKLTQVLFRVSR